MKAEEALSRVMKYQGADNPSTMLVGEDPQNLLKVLQEGWSLEDMRQGGVEPLELMNDRRKTKTRAILAMFAGTAGLSCAGFLGVSLPVFAGMAVLGVGGPAVWHALRRSKVSVSVDSQEDDDISTNYALVDGWVRKQLPPLIVSKGFDLPFSVRHHPLLKNPEWVLENVPLRDRLLKELKHLRTDIMDSSDELYATGAIRAAQGFEDLLRIIERVEAEFNEEDAGHHMRSLLKKDKYQAILGTLHATHRLRGVLDSMQDALKRTRGDLIRLDRDIRGSERHMVRVQDLSKTTGSEAGLTEANRESVKARQKWNASMPQVAATLTAVSELAIDVLPSPQNHGWLMNQTVDRIMERNAARAKRERELQEAAK